MISVSSLASRFRQLHGEMTRRTRAGVTEGVFLLVLADDFEKVLEIADRDGRRRADQQRADRQQRDRREVVHEVIRQVLEQQRVDGVDRRRQHQRVAVRRRLRDRVGADRSARPARAVFDDRRPARDLIELLHQDAGDAIDRSAGRERHDHGDGAVRIGLRRGKVRQTRPARRQPARETKAVSSQSPKYQSDPYLSMICSENRYTLFGIMLQ